MKFIRYGALVPQPHEPTEEWFHSPPCKKGFYAFPEHCVEGFLLGGVGMGSIQNGRYRYVKINGKKVNLPARELWDQDDEKHEYKEPFLSEIKKQGLDPKKVYAWKTNADEVNKKFDSAEYCLYDDEDIKYTPKDERWDSYLFTLVVENPPHKFEYNGFIWHHMDKWCDGLDAQVSQFYEWLAWDKGVEDEVAAIGDRKVNIAARNAGARVLARMEPA